MLVAVIPSAEEKSRKIAVNLLKEGLSTELVAKNTGLAVEVVQQLPVLKLRMKKSKYSMKSPV
ncbi:hypothetical protein NIES267_28660 [Calothrix parasitica NIES-267]|uniref:Uncharacterized protein n=1 Tax=Calothrix parasitica NIES-267 TaxID=1973488 RepID=A0A1Z4LQI7_9CYAN|nr:hypothetical protein NIES267_28660 [Calothrix parasitica NIES-267]